MIEANNSISNTSPAHKVTFTPEYLNSVFTYEEESGHLIWKPRPRHEFASLRGWGTWNAQQVGNPAGTKSYNPDGYPKKIQVRLQGTAYSAHSIIFRMKNIVVPAGMVIDHSDRNPFNNKWHNLRISTHSQNNFNSGKKVKNGRPKGVLIHRSKSNPNYIRYYAAISCNGTRFFGTARKTIEEAAEDYRKLAEKHHGDFTFV